MRSGFLSCLMLAICASAANGQQRESRIQGPVSSVLFSHQAKPDVALSHIDSTTAPPPTHWKEGLMIGGGIGGLGLAYLLHGICDDGESCIGPAIGGAALGAVIGGTIGALIGGQFPRPVDTIPSPDSAAASR